MATAAFTLILGAAVLLLLAVAMACVLGWANQAFQVEVDPQVETVNDALPGANCGGCGYVGCREYAEAVAAGHAAVTLCAPGGTSCAEQLAAIMGTEVRPSYPYRAVVHCAARSDQRLPVPKPEYTGELTCTAANLVSGFQGCTYGCLGLGDCVRACDYDAIHTVEGLATVDYDACIGCKACAVACPRNIISMVPFKAERMLVVACSNRDTGPAVKAVCPVGCISCSLCAKKSDRMEMDNGLPVIDYERYENECAFADSIKKCRRESLVFVGKPRTEELEQVADEELPARIEAAFHTTVDETDWRG